MPEDERDTHIFLGKFSLVYTNRSQKTYSILLALATIAAAMLTIFSFADAVGQVLGDLRDVGPR